MDKNSESFNHRSDEYAQARPRYPLEFYDFLLSLTRNHHRLWDCACGNGQVAIDMVEYFDELHATDISKNQLKNAFRHPKIKYASSSSESTLFPAEFFDMICVAQALHWFNLDKFFTETRRVLKPGGILAVFGYGFFTITDEIDRIIEETFYATIDDFWSEKNRLLMSGFKGVKFPFSKVDIPVFSMDQNWSLSALIDYLNTWSAVKRYNETTGRNITGQLQENLILVWDLNELKTVKMELHSHIRRK